MAVMSECLIVDGFRARRAQSVRTNIPSVREGYEGFRNAGRGKVIELDVDHHCMLTAPEETVRALIECLP